MLGPNVAALAAEATGLQGLKARMQPSAIDGGAKEAAEKRSNAVILSAAKDLALSVFKAMRDSSSLLLLRMTAL